MTKQRTATLLASSLDNLSVLTGKGNVARKTDHYRKEILKFLYVRRQASCAEISLETGKSIPLVTKLLGEMVKADIVEQLGLSHSVRGRKPVLFALKKNSSYVVAVAADQFITRLAIINSRNEIVGEEQHCQISLHQNGRALDTICQKVEDLIETAGIAKSRIAGVGVAMPGFINVNSGINYSYLQTADGGNIPDYLFQRLGLPVFVDNDATLMALAELKFGSLHGKKSAMVINIGWGVGLGVILEGRMYRGMNGFAGEFSHIPLFNNEKLCVCGKHGCLDTEVSLDNLVLKAKEKLQKGELSKLTAADLEGGLETSVDRLMQAAKSGDTFAVRLFSEAAYCIGKSMAALIHILNPEVFILTGRGAALGNLWLAPIHQSLNENCIPSLAANTEIKVSDLGLKADLIGAAALVMEHHYG